MKEIMMELELLYSKMNETNKEVECEIGNKCMPFSKLIYAITKGLTKEDIFMMDDDSLLKHIQKIQLIEG
jgi:hypothetical protein